MNFTFKPTAPWIRPLVVARLNRPCLPRCKCPACKILLEDLIALYDSDPAQARPLLEMLKDC